MSTSGLPTIVDAMRSGMPWSGKEFASRHNHKLKGKAAERAAHQANAMLKAGVPEGIAIATANKHAKKKHHPATQKDGIRKMYTNS